MDGRDLVARDGRPGAGARNGPTPTASTLRWVDDGAPVSDFVTVADAAYASLGMPIGVMRTSFTSVEAMSSPEVRTVIAYLDDEPVATAQTLLSHGIAGVYCVATLEAARGRGLGDLVTRAVTNRAFDEGARANTLQASSMGEPIYVRMGWRGAATATPPSSGSRDASRSAGVESIERGDRRRVRRRCRGRGRRVGGCDVARGS